MFVWRLYLLVFPYLFMACYTTQGIQNVSFHNFIKYLHATLHLPYIPSPFNTAGYTRLSGSGLSMTDWRLEGRRLPWTQEGWVKEFEEYKKYPESLGPVNTTQTQRLWVKVWWDGKCLLWIFCGRFIFVWLGAVYISFMLNVYKTQYHWPLTMPFCGTWWL